MEGADPVDHQGGYMSNMDHPQYHHIRIKVTKKWSRGSENTNKVQILNVNPNY